MQPQTPPHPQPSAADPDAAVTLVEQVAREAELAAYYEAQVKNLVTNHTKRIVWALLEIAEATDLDPLTVLEHITSTVRKSQAATPQEACKQCHGRGFYRLPYRFTGQESDYAECDLCEARHSAPNSQASATTDAAVTFAQSNKASGSEA